MKDTESQIILWDADNTIWDWMKYAVPAYKAMCGTIARIAGKGEDETADAMKAFYTSKGTIEDEGLVQGLNDAGYFTGVSGFNEEAAIQGVKRAFSRERDKHLEMYPVIAEIIAEVRNAGMRQILLTDAPRRPALARLERFDLLDKFDEVYTMESSVVPRLPQGYAARQAPTESNFHVVDVEKPHTDLEEMLGITRGEIARRLTVIGDNERKEIRFAETYGCRALHAAYGVPTLADGESLGRFAPAAVIRRNMQAEVPIGVVRSTPSRVVTITHPGQIRGHIFMAQ